MVLRVVIIILLFPICIQAQSKKIAFLVGVNEYKDQRWDTIHGADDVDLLEEKLLKNGFEVRILKNKDATSSKIQQEMDRLIAEVQLTDKVLIHFSVHGQQITDLGKEEPDGLDECLIPYDCPFGEGRIENEPESIEKRLTDDWLEEKINLLRRKIGVEGGGQILVLLDACQSGGGTRSYFNDKIAVRGASPLLLNDNPVYERPDNLQFSNNSVGLAPLIAFFATAPGQLNYEQEQAGKVYGSLSSAFYHCLDNPQSSYQLMFENIYQNISNKIQGQTPTAEGNLARVFMGNEIDVQTPHFIVDKALQPDYILLQEGWLSGLCNGTELVFYPSDTWISKNNTVQPIAIGKVKTADIFGAEVVLDRNISESDVVGAWGYIKNWNNEGDRMDYKQFIQMIKETTDDRASAKNKKGKGNSPFDFTFEKHAFPCDEYGTPTGKAIIGDTLQSGDCFSLSLFNKRETELYFQVLNFPADNPDTAFLLIPTDNAPDEIFSVKGRSKWDSAEKIDERKLIWKISSLPNGLTEGKELFKLIVSDRPFVLPFFNSNRGTKRSFLKGNNVSGQPFALYNLSIYVKNEE